MCVYVIIPIRTYIFFFTIIMIIISFFFFFIFESVLCVLFFISFFFFFCSSVRTYFLLRYLRQTDRRQIYIFDDDALSIITRNGY